MQEYLKQLNKQIIDVIEQGKIIAYPTEAVFGLGCDPFNQAAVQRLKQLKRRPELKGLILITDSIKKTYPLVAGISPEKMQELTPLWPGPVTYVFNANTKVPQWVCSQDNKIAIRVSSHPIVKAICQNFVYPLVSTSANYSGEAPAKTAAEVETMFGTQIDLIVPGEVGSLARPTKIIDTTTGQILRD
ncbi:MAG: L-threonylcarbamoyladenylate synthase [Pseudomonadota bacterium]